MRRAKTWFQVKNSSEGQPTEILIYEQIGKDWWDDSGVGAKDFAEALKEIPRNQEILICINSPGGNVWDGLGIYHQLQARRDHVTTRIDGVAASIASIIAMAGKETRMPANAMIMIHDPSAGVLGGAEDMRKMADYLDKHKEVLAGIYHAKTGTDLDEIRDAMSEETWFNGAEAKKFGLVDTVLDETEITASFDLKQFRNAPGSLKSPSRPPVDSQPHPRMIEAKTILTRIKNLLGEDVGLVEEDVVPKSAYVLLETGHKELVTNFAKLETDLAAGRLQVTNLEKEKTDLAAKVTDLEAKAAKAKTDLEAAIKEHGGKEAASILAKLGVTPVKIEPEPDKASKTLMQEFTEAKGADRQVLLNKYGADNIFKNVRKSPGQ